MAQVLGSSYEGIRVNNGWVLEGTNSEGESVPVAVGISSDVVP